MSVIVPAPVVVVSTNVLDAVAEWLVGNPYPVGADAYRVVDDKHVVYRSIATPNTGQPPESSSDHWVKIGVTNIYKMFDTYVSSQTEHLDSIAVTLAVSKIDRVAFFGLEGESVRIVARNGATVISDETLSLRLDNASQSWSDFFFNDIEYRSDFVHPVGGLYRNLELDITITAASGATAKCGYCVVGRSQYIGQSRYGIKNGLSSYTESVINQFGEYQIAGDRSLGKSLVVDLWIAVHEGRKEIDSVTKIMRKLHNVPCVWDFNNNGSVESWVALGIYKDFYQVVPAGQYSQCNLEIIGIT